MKATFCFILVQLVHVCPQSSYSRFTVLYQWKYADYDYASEAARQSDINNGSFKIGVPTIIDVDFFYTKNKQQITFVTTPRFNVQIPASLAIVSSKIRNGSNLLAPYPNWSWHQDPTKCKTDRIVSCFRTIVDECGRLWVLDSGVFGNDLICAPQILAFDIETNKLVHRFEIPSTQLDSISLLITLMVDVRKQCDDTFVYAADVQSFAIIVYDTKNKISWKVKHESMFPWPNFGTYNILGDTFHLMDGIFALALSPYREGQDRALFYHAMTGPTENFVWTSNLRNRTRFATGPESSPEIFNTFVYGRGQQSAADAIDDNGIMFFSMLASVTFDCWNIHTEYQPQNWDVVDANREIMQFPTGVKIRFNHYTNQQEIWVLSSRFQKVSSGTVNLSEINFRVLATTVNNLVAGSKCNIS